MGSQLNLANCGTSGSGVTVTGNSITWNNNVAPNYGCINIDSTNVVFSGGNLAGGEIGEIHNLTALPNVAITGFMIFVGGGSNPGVGTLSFDIGAAGLGPGLLNACTGAETNGQSCSVAGAGPFVLTKSSTGTSVTLSAHGTVSDGTVPISTWQGSYTTQFAGLAPIDIQNFIEGLPDSNTGLGCVAGSCTSTYSGSFNVTVSQVPEPSSMFLIGAGLIGLVASKRKKYL